MHSVSEVVFNCLLPQQRHMSDTTTLRTSIKDTESFFLFIAGAHKIVSAIYLITELWDPREPLRWSLRKDVLDMAASVADIFFQPTGMLEPAADRTKGNLE